MIAADTSSIIAFLIGDSGKDVELVQRALDGQLLVFPPVVKSEMLCDPKLEPDLWGALRSVPVMGLVDGFWERVGRTRARLLQRRVKASLADALIAQSCIDSRLPLITRDSDFRHFAKHCGLKLLT